jgi:hypothetical protein
VSRETVDSYKRFRQQFDASIGLRSQSQNGPSYSLEQKLTEQTQNSSYDDSNSESNDKNGQVDVNDRKSDAPEHEQQQRQQHPDDSIDSNKMIDFRQRAKQEMAASGLYQSSSSAAIAAAAEGEGTVPAVQIVTSANLMQVLSRHGKQAEEDRMEDEGRL